MTSPPDPEIANMDGSLALPRKNGELVFEALWEGRLFGMAAVLNERGFYPWREFRDQLAAEIAAADAGDTPTSYYERFLASFEKLVIAKGLLTAEELDAQTSEFALGERQDEEEDHHHQ